MKSIILFTYAVCLLIVFASCGGDSGPSSEPANPSKNSSTAKIDIPATENTKPVIDNKGGTASIKFSATGNWTVSSSDSWCEVTPTSGQAGTSTLTFTAGSYDAKNDRVATITIKCGDAKATVTVTQRYDFKTVERAALMDLFNSTDGKNWTNKDNWGSGEALSKWYGVTTDLQGRVTHITLSWNNLRGHIPESIGDLTNLIYLNLCFNQLSGEIPESIGNLTKLAYLVLGANELTGSVPKTIANIAKLERLDVSQNKMNGTIPAEITNASWWDLSKIAKGQQDGYFLRYESIYESTDYSQDGKIITLQSHTVGNGVPLVILGDAFSDRLIANNTFSNFANEVMEAFFELEPFITFRDYFDVYAVVAVSLNEITGEDTAYKIDYANNIPIEGMDKIKSDVLRIPSLNGSIDNVTCAIIYNEADPGQQATYSWHSYIDASGNGFNIGECPINDGQLNKYLVHHEVGGHCFGGLADERVNDYAPNVYPESDYEILDLWHSEGYNYNIDYHNTKETSFWKDFFANPEYEVEKLDLYEGALYTYGKGIYRPSFSSIMKKYDENYYYYNAPSRLAMYKRIMELSGEGYSFEKFLEYDKKNLEAIKNGAITRNYVERYNNDISIESPCVISFK